MNLNELAKEIAKLEGGKKNLSIAQIKEVVRCLSLIQFQHDVYQVDIATFSKKSLFWKIMLNGAKQVKRKKK